MPISRFETPEDAEDAFYRAFQNRDANAMMEVWAQDENIVCIHPSGSRLEGRTVIARRWQNIFEHSPELEFTISDVLRTRTEDMAVHIMHEHIRVDKAERHQPPVIATNVYRRTADGWRMVLHHGSPGPAQEQTPQAALH